MLPVIAAFILFLAAGCSNNTPKVNNPTPNLPSSDKLSLPPDNPFIPGKYITVEEANFYTVWDTIIIAPVPHQVKRFRILQNTAFEKNILDATPSIERDHLEWYGLYDDVSEVLTGISKNIDLHCMPAKQQISLWGIVYNRVE